MTKQEMDKEVQWDGQRQLSSTREFPNEETEHFEHTH